MVIAILLLLLLAGYIETNAAVGNKCNWVSDCDLNETCRPVPYHQRDGSSYNGICVPNNW